MEYEVYPSESTLGHRILSSAEIHQAVDTALQQYGIHLEALQESCGMHLARVALQMLRAMPTGKKRRVGVLCGSGMHGANGVVAARYLLTAGVDVEVIASHARSEPSVDGLQTLRKLGVTCVEMDDREMVPTLPRPGAYDLLIDALASVKSTQPLSGVQAETVAWINGHGAKVLSADIPSGLNCDTGEIATTAVKADVTVTYCASKPGFWVQHGPEYVGRLLVVDVGLPMNSLMGDVAQLFRRLLRPSDAMPAFAPRNPRAYKGNFGHVYLLGGSLGRTGAIRMAGQAALRAGAGLCTLATTAQAFPMLQGSLNEMMAEGVLSETLTASELVSHIAAHDVLVAGPGLERPYAQLLFEALPQIAMPAVLDAGALSGLDFQDLSGSARDWALARLGQGGPRVLTPHPGEAAHLLGCTPAEIQKNRFDAARHLYEATGAEIVLKGAHTMIYGSSGVAICPFGNPGMATAGMGDVLAGVMGALLARGLDAETAAQAATVWHALAGDACARESTQNALLATDVAAALPVVERAICAQQFASLERFSANLPDEARFSFHNLCL